MPKVHFVKSARKSNPAAEVGDAYYWWAFRQGGKHYSKTPPRPSQLTSSEKKSRSYAASECIEDLRVGELVTKEDVTELAETLADELVEIAETVREIASEYSESASTIRDSFSESPTADLCDENCAELESWADEIDQAAEALQGLDTDASIDDLQQQCEDIISGISGSPI